MAVPFGLFVMGVDLCVRVADGSDPVRAECTVKCMPVLNPVCRKCGYPLSSVPVAGDDNVRTCPECGLRQSLAARSHRRRPAFRAAIGFLVGAVVTVPAVALALSSIGDGHGDYGFARLLFPFSMLLAALLTREITTPLIILALLQFPTCGAAAGVLSTRGLKGYLGLSAIALAYAIAIALCFSGLITP